MKYYYTFSYKRLEKTSLQNFPFTKWSVLASDQDHQTHELLGKKFDTGVDKYICINSSIQCS